MALLQANTDLMIALKPLDIHFLRVAGVVRCIKVIMGGEEREVGEVQVGEVQATDGARSHLTPKENKNGDVEFASRQIAGAWNTTTGRE